jgi:hypothetical protein
MDTWKGEKLHGADRRLTRAQLEECDRMPAPTRLRSKVQRDAARLLRALGEIYVRTRGRGLRWRAAVAVLVRLAS